MPKIGYKFENIESVLIRIQSANPYPTSAMLNDLKKELNKFFTGTECVDIIFTKNTDKLFFGMCVMPVIKDEDVMKIITTDEKMQIKKYYLEIDSKLLNLSLTKEEFAAVLLHEIGHMIINDQPIEMVRNSIDTYLADNDEIISIKDSAMYNKILNFGIKDTLRKFTSMLFKDNSEMIADAFVSSCGYGEDLISAQDKICNNAWGLSKNVRAPKIVILDWVFRLYKNVKFGRIPAIKTLEKSKLCTGSKLTKQEVDKVIKVLNKLDSDLIEESTYLLESVKKKKSFVERLKINGLRSIEDDYYEFKVRIKNAETEDEALYALRQINSRLTILDDYLMSEDLDQAEYDKWHSLLQKYKSLRDDIAAKKIYNKKNYGIWYSYNQLDSDDKMY